MEQDQEDDQRIKGGSMKDFSIKTIYKGTELEFDVEAGDIDAALDEGKEIAKMVYEQHYGDLKKSEIYIIVGSL